MLRAAVVVCALALVAGSFGASAAPVPVHLMPKPEPLFFPTTVGAKHVSIWNKKELVEVASKVTKIEGGFEVEMETVHEDGTHTHSETVRVTSRGLVRTHSDGKQLALPCELLVLPHVANNTWKSNWGGQIRVLSTAGWEEIEVPAGKVRAMRVDSDETGDGVPDSAAWDAPGIGCVSWYCQLSKCGRPLKSFTPGK